MYRFEGKRILLNSLYVKFKKMKDKGYKYIDISKKTGYSRQYVRGVLKKYKYQIDDDFNNLNYQAYKLKKFE